MATFLELKKNLKKDMTGLKPFKMAVLGDCATQHLSQALRGEAYERGIALSVYDADYDEIMAQITDPSSELYDFAPEAVLIVMCTERLYSDYCRTELAERKNFADNRIKLITSLWDRLLSVKGIKVLQPDLPEADDGIYGNFGLKYEDSFIYQQRRLNFLLMQESAARASVSLINLSTIKSELGNAFRDDKMYFAARMPFSMEALPRIAASVMNTVDSALGRIRKCVVLDLDNTLWGGVIGDDGLSGIEVGELGTGRAFHEFQTWLKELKNRGIILAVCSKNNEDTAKEPFEKHPEMVLKLDDIACFIANWDDKATNIRKIQSILNIGMDSLVFIDDNRFERELVRSMIPEITVPDMPEDPSSYVPYLKSLGLFETTGISAEDAGRTEKYRAEAERVKSMDSFSDYSEYLKSLEMKAVAAPFDEFHFPRIAELSQRSNQFNLRTVRYQTGDIEKMSSDDSYITLYFTLKDRFGDHGLISAVIMKKLEDRVFVDTWFMSCRVLKRTMEEYIINSMVKAAADAGYDLIEAEYIPTAKNKMVADIYPKMGFKEMQDKPGHYLVKPSEFKPLVTYIS